MSVAQFGAQPPMSTFGTSWKRNALWRHGAAAAKVETVDVAHTGIGYATQQAATILLAAIL